MTPTARKDTKDGERIAKRLARAGLCSRREAERWIAAGRVDVDGRTIDTPATIVTAETRIKVDGKPVGAAEKARLWRYNKPAGLICTNNDPEGRRTIFDALPKTLPRVLTIGRLDLTSEGLMLLTNDGELARRLELPSTGWTRRYRARVFGRIDEDALARLEKGVTIDGVRYGGVRARLERVQGANSWLAVAIKEGKNREVRRVLEHLGLTVSRLIRVAYGPFQTGHLKFGEVEEVTGKVLREQLGDADRRR